MGGGFKVKARRIGLLGAAMCALTLALCSQATAASCPNEPLREAQGATSLPPCMALEMVSPPKKASEPAFSPSFSLDGERVLFAAQAALAGTPGYQGFAGDRYVATRTATNWEIAPTSPPLAEIVGGAGVTAALRPSRPTSAAGTFWAPPSPRASSAFSSSSAAASTAPSPHFLR